MANRILGMGDVLSLIEKAQSSVDMDAIKGLDSKMKNMDFNFDDFLLQMQQIKKMGSLKSLIEMIPGLSKQMKNIDVDDKELVKIEAIIQSMTKQERANPSIINGSRKLRIAKGSGMQVNQINRLLKQFEETRKMMKQMSTFTKGRKKMKFPFLGM